MAAQQQQQQQENIDWAELDAKLPHEKTPSARARRDELWRGIDVNGNGYLSLAEVDKGVRDVLGLEASVYDAKPAIMRAFQAARRVSSSSSSSKGNNNNTTTSSSKKHSGGGGNDDDDYIERSEFRLLLLYLGRYFELYRAFARLDAGDDGRVDRAEFARARPLVEGWVGVPLEDYEGEFDRIDRNGGGQILFGEFAEWAIGKSLDLEEGGDGGDE
ncbi:flagellar calcium-binding protein-like protein TB-44A [Xylariomycetidae sp. FL2044]|nr:flagellar calcium-binding protein-like protein TB-44A [Xylariomycetidae sp. FL2044]